MPEPIVVVDGLRVTKYGAGSPVVALELRPQTRDITSVPELDGIDLAEVDITNLPGPMAVDDGPVAFARYLDGIVKWTYEKGASFDEDSAPFEIDQRETLEKFRDLLKQMASEPDCNAITASRLRAARNALEAESWSDLREKIEAVKKVMTVHAIVELMRGVQGKEKTDSMEQKMARIIESIESCKRDEAAGVINGSTQRVKKEEEFSKLELQMAGRIEEIAIDAHPRLFPRNPTPDEALFAQHRIKLLADGGRKHVLKACDFFRNAKFPFHQALLPLAKLLESDDVAIARLASHAVENMSKRGAVQRGEVIGVVAKAAKSRDECVKRHAEKALMNWGLLKGEE